MKKVNGVLRVVYVGMSCVYSGANKGDGAPLSGAQTKRRSFIRDHALCKARSSLSDQLCERARGLRGDVAKM